MQYILQKIGMTLAIPVIAVLQLVGLTPQPVQAPITIPAVTQTLGAANTIETPVALFQTSLATAITSSASSMTLASGLTKDGTTLASSTYSFIIDEGTAIQEFVKADCTNTACTNMVRGLSVVSGTTTIPTLQQAHRRGATVKITDAPLLLRITNLLNGGEKFSNPIQYSTSLSTTTLALDRSNIASVGLLQDTAFSGAGVINASTAAKGVSQIATATQAASSTVTGSSGAQLVLPSSISTSTAGTASQLIPVTKVDGTLDQGFLPATVTKNITFTGGVTFSSTTGVTTKFGGTGADGAFATTSTGTTTIDLASAPIFTKNYTSFTLGGTGVVAFINPNINGTIIIFKVKNNFTCTSTAGTAINAIGMGSAGGAAGSGNATATVPSVARTSNPFQVIPVGSDTTAGVAPISLATNPLVLHSLILGTGQGGGGGGQATAGADGHGGAGGSSLFTSGTNGTNTGGNTGGTVSGPGGRGGAAFYLETAGTYTNSCTISTAGVRGTDAGSSGSGAGGGGAGGSLASLYNILGADTGTYSVSGALGGSGVASGNHGGSAGANGTSTVGLNTEF